MQTTPPTVLLFLKAPRPGFVKTRLAVDLGDDIACEIFKSLASQTLATIPSDWPIRVFFTPSDALLEMTNWLGNSSTFLPQIEGDLGQRLEAATRETFANGASSVILLGGDCPGITTDHLNKAAQCLANKQAVIGPAADGGYWLLGLPKDAPEAFQDITWSSDSVFSTTLNKLATLDLSPHQLETLEDVDDIDAWTRAQAKHPNLKKLSPIS